MLAGGHLSTMEPPDVQSQHLSLPLHILLVMRLQWSPPNLELSGLDIGGIVCRSGGLPCLFQQVVSNNGNVVDTVCLRNDDLKAKLVLVELDDPCSQSGLFRCHHSSSVFRVGIVVKWGKWVPLPDFFFVFEISWSSVGTPNLSTYFISLFSLLVGGANRIEKL
jgi:hypothetical protein